MKKVWTEVLFDIRKNPYLFLVMIIQLTICFAVGLFSDLLEKEMDQYKDSVLQEQGEGELYFLTDNLVGEYEKAFFRSEDAMAKLKIMYSMLANDDRFEYLEMYNNPIVLIGENIKDEVLYRYEAGEAENYRAVENGEIYNEVKCLWMSCNVGDFFGLQCHEGNLWSEEEKNGQPIPIVLGSDYQGRFEVGNIISGLSPVADHVQFQIHGILEEGQWVTYKGRVLNLDRYALIPLQDAKTVALTNVEKWNQRMLYLFKVNGILRSKLSANELEDIVQGICDACGVYPASVVSGSTNLQGYIINIDIQDVLVILKQMLIMLNVFSGIATALYAIMKIDKNKEADG